MHEINTKSTRTEEPGRRLVRAIVGIALIGAVVGAVPLVGIWQPSQKALLPLGPVMRFIAWVDPAFSTAPEVREVQRSVRNRVDQQQLVAPNAKKDKQPQPQVGLLTVKQGTLLARKT